MTTCNFTSGMALKNNIIRNDSGSVLVLVALMLPLLLLVVGVSVDLGRLYAVRARAQGALDAALLGGVSTSASTPVQAETQSLFRANFPTGYMGSTVTGPTVTQSGTDYIATLQVRVPWAFMQMFSVSPVTLHLSARVGQATAGRPVELALVVDNSEDVAVPGMRSQLRNFVRDLFDESPNSYVSVVPFNVGVHIGISPISRINWAQDSMQYTIYGLLGAAYLAGRNPDIPPNGGYNDVSDAPPTVAMTTRFRMPYGPSPGDYNNGDFVTGTLAAMAFAERESNASSTLNAMRAGGRTRIHVGMMWGWFALSPRWQGRWDAAKPALPLVATGAGSKQMILVVGSRNSVYLGGNQACGAGICPVSNDNTTLGAMCTAIKSQGIYVYTIGYGNATDYDGLQLQNCSSGTGYYYTAANNGALNAVLTQILDRLKSSSITLKQ